MKPHMIQRRLLQRPRMGRASVLVLFVLALALVGCGSVEIRPAQPENNRVASRAEESSERDLAVGSLQISPDLSRAIDLAGGCTSFELRVTVENRGSLEEEDVLVEAWLKAPPEDGGMVLLQAVEVLPSIEGGSARLVKLNAAGIVPILSSYVLEVAVRPARYEQYLDNNVAQYEIAVVATDGPMG